MLSKNIFIIVVLIMACGDTKKTNPGYIGEKLDNKTMLFNAYGIQSNNIYFIDAPTSRILGVDLGDMSISAAFPITNIADEHTLASSYDGSYVIDFSKNHLDVIQANGVRESRPFAFQGTPISAAHNPKKHILVMEDDLQSIGLIELSADGKILKSWLGGPLLSTGKSILAGDIDDSGRLVLAASDNSTVIVDIDKSIDAGAWKFSGFANGIDKVHWVAPDIKQADLCLILADNAMAVFNVQTKAVTDQISLSDNGLTVLGQSKLIKPHVLVANAKTATKQLYFIGADGKLAVHDLPQYSLDGYSVSYLDADATNITTMKTDGDTHSVIKMRLTDNLVMLNNSVTTGGDVQLGADVLFINRKSQLGYLQLYDLTSKSSRDLKGFNFDFFRSSK